MTDPSLAWLPVGSGKSPVFLEQGEKAFGRESHQGVSGGKT